MNDFFIILCQQISYIVELSLSIAFSQSLSQFLFSLFSLFLVFFVLLSFLQNIGLTFSKMFQHHLDHFYYALSLLLEYNIVTHSTFITTTSWWCSDKILITVSKQNRFRMKKTGTCVKPKFQLIKKRSVQPVAACHNINCSSQPSPSTLKFQSSCRVLNSNQINLILLYVPTDYYNLIQGQSVSLLAFWLKKDL